MRTPRPQPGHPQAEQGGGQDNGTDDETNRTEDAKAGNKTNEQSRNQARPPEKARRSRETATPASARSDDLSGGCGENTTPALPGNGQQASPDGS